MFADVLDEKEALKDYKNNCLRKTQKYLEKSFYNPL